MNAYPMPDITMSTLNVVILLAVDGTLSVSVAVVTWSTAKTIPSLFQVIVIGPLAVPGYQFVTDMVNVNCVLPIFFT